MKQSCSVLSISSTDALNMLVMSRGDFSQVYYWSGGIETSMLVNVKCVRKYVLVKIAGVICHNERPWGKKDHRVTVLLQNYTTNTPLTIRMAAEQLHKINTLFFFPYTSPLINLLQHAIAFCLLFLFGFLHNPI